MVLDGYINLNKTDVYNFYISSDDGSMLYIDGKLVINNDGLHGMNEEKGTAALAAGYHSYVLNIFEKTGGDDLTN